MHEIPNYKHQMPNKLQITSTKLSEAKLSEIPIRSGFQINSKNQMPNSIQSKPQVLLIPRMRSLDYLYVLNISQGKNDIAVPRIRKTIK